MRRYLLPLLLLLAACEPDTEPNRQLSTEEQKGFLKRLALRLGAGEEQPVSPEDVKLISIAIDSADTARFLVYCTLPALRVKQAATVGKAYPAHSREGFSYYQEAISGLDMSLPGKEAALDTVFGRYVRGEAIRELADSADLTTPHWR